MNLIDLVKEAGLTPIRTGSSYSSPCPSCGGNDRFVIWPDKYWCRRCQKHGDSIQFCRDFLGMSFLEACKKLSIERVFERPQMIKKEPEIIKIAHRPPSLWQAKATAFAKWSHENLLSNPNQIAQLMERGLNMETIIQFGLGFCVDKSQKDPSGFFREKASWGLSDEYKGDRKTKKLWLPYGHVIPFLGSDGLVLKLKIRRLDWREGDKWPKYMEIPGSMQQPSWFGLNDELPVAIVEAEFDAMLIHQEAGNLCSTLALGGAKKKPDLATDQKLRKSPLLLYALDFDEAGKEQFIYWRKNYSQLRAWPTPKSKSPGDALKEGVDIRQWIANGVFEYENILKGINREK